MRYQDKLVAALYDFDAYALFYRADLFTQHRVSVPRTWTELREASGKLAAAADASGQNGKQRMQIVPNTFRYSQLLFQAGGDILDREGRNAVFAGPAGVKALSAYRELLRVGGVYWGVGQGQAAGAAGIKDGRIAMFLNGPFMMGVLKNSVPEQASKWKVAPAPIDSMPGSYLGGTGLVVPTNAKHKSAAWRLIQFLLRDEQQIQVYATAGAAPATLPALRDPELTKPDPYFGGQRPFPVFQDALATAKPFPYVAAWQDIDRVITEAVTACLLDRKPPHQALADAAKEVNDLLGK
jgi:multiple sugar transport system substrate-binding protein